MLAPNLAREIVACIRAVSHPRRIILFGSRARGDADPRSDIDLAISAGAMTPSEWLRILASLETVGTLLPIQAVLLEEAPARLRERVAREGIDLYAEPEGRG
jgi:predicted nucleotidyltransferase